ncbi:group II intron maturase-specific domain-containing protein [Nonomuraea sp. 3N208]|uniref:group II intron maturase-specific domain-containing protein n=1 Tax=Nonomuraea sp. 3N208 TaxID=3457421 RepID=UPI003FD58D25
MNHSHELAPAFLRGWAGYFKYGHSARRHSKIRRYAQQRLARFVSKKHRRSGAFGWWVMTCSRPIDLGLISRYSASPRSPLVTAASSVGR